MDLAELHCGLEMRQYMSPSVVRLEMENQKPLSLKVRHNRKTEAALIKWPGTGSFP